MTVGLGYLGRRASISLPPASPLLEARREHTEIAKSAGGLVRISGVSLLAVGNRRYGGPRVCWICGWPSSLLGAQEDAASCLLGWRPGTSRGPVVLNSRVPWFR